MTKGNLINVHKLVRQTQTVHILLPGAAPESDRQMFQEVHHQSRLLARQLGHQVCVPLHGQVSFPLNSVVCNFCLQVHGLLQPGVEGLHQEAAADAMMIST